MFFFKILQHSTTLRYLTNKTYNHFN